MIIRFLSFVFVFFFSFLVFPRTTLAQSATSCFTTDIGNPQASPIVPAECNLGASEGALGALKLAQQQMGKPYEWAAPKPRNWASWKPPKLPPTFDCSGLVGWAWYWATDGKVNFPGYTGAMWDQNTLKLTKYNADRTYKQLQPGDVLFFGSPSHHTALYEGSMGVACKEADCFIEAPHTGANVRESHLSGRSDWVGYLRPM